MGEQRPRILLADDHPMMLAGLREILGPVFDVVGTATDGRALLELAEVRRPDLVIADISMPGINGIEATRRLRDLLPETRVLILSLTPIPNGRRQPSTPAPAAISPRTPLPRRSRPPSAKCSRGTSISARR